MGPAELMDKPFRLRGWIELNGRRLSNQDITHLLRDEDTALFRCGGEFSLTWGNCAARDHFGIMPGYCPPGTIVCNGEPVGGVSPDLLPLSLEAAILAAVDLRSDEGIIALSGGVDSALIAARANLPCLAVGTPDSHDLKHAALVAGELDCKLTRVELSPRQIKEALLAVLPEIPRVTPVDASIAATLFCVAHYASDHGHERVIAGQGADELFGGYARYLESTTLQQDLDADVAGLPVQTARDQAVASIHGCYFSLPYLDIRVVRAARAIPAEEKVKDGIRKRPLRLVAERHMPRSIAYYDKKAMQYGSGVWRVLQRLARENGYNRVADYLKRLEKSGDIHPLL